MSNSIVFPLLRIILAGVITFYMTPLQAADPIKRNVPEWLAKHEVALQAQWSEEDGSPKVGAMRGVIKFVFGNHIWQPGKEFKNGSNWLALICNQAGCRFEPANLKVKKESWQGHYDDSPTMGQILDFSLVIPSKDKSIAWFESNEKSPTWLQAGAIKTYYSVINKIKRPKSKGTFEVEVSLPDGGSVVFVPMLDNLSENNNGALLQLRESNKRQMLLGTLANCAGVETMENSPNYLQWAGDLDKDGKPDYLVNYIDADGVVHLYLSSLAKTTELVGLAGVYMSSPFGGECDGYGW